MKIQKQNFGLGVRGGGGQVGSEQRIDVNVTIQKKIWGGSDWGVRVEVNEEVIVKIPKKSEGGSGGSGWGVRVYVNEKLELL